MRPFSLARFFGASVIMLTSILLSTVTYSQSLSDVVYTPEFGSIISSELINAEPDTNIGFFGDLHDSIIDASFKRSLDKSFRTTLHALIYFDGYSIARRDLWGQTRSFLSREEEAELRQEMAEVILDYLLSRGLSKFLKTRRDAEFVNNAIVALERAGQIQTSIATSKYDTNPWKVKSGFQPIQLLGFAKLYNRDWAADLVTKLKISNSPFSRLTLRTTRNWRVWSSGLIYDFLGNNITQFTGATWNSRMNLRFLNTLYFDNDAANKYFVQIKSNLLF